MTESTAGIASGRARSIRLDSLWPGAGSSILARGTTGTADLLALSALLVLTAAFGRPFSKLGVPSANLYVTEFAIVVTAALALRRCGVGGIVERLRATVPLVPIAIFWVAGAVAILRGLNAYSLMAQKPEIGLVEYSVFIPLVAVAADTREKVATLIRVLAAGGVAATVVFALVYFFAPHSAIGIDRNPSCAVGLFIALFVVLFASWALHGLARETAGRVGAVLALGAVVLMSLALARSVLVALAAAAVVLVALAPARTRLRAALVVVVGIVVSVVGALAVQDIGVGAITTIPGVPSAPSVLEPGRAADDGLTEFVGGKVVETDSVAGRRSREIRAGARPYFETRVSPLVPGRRYTVRFWVKPRIAVATRGRVGDTSGGGWDVATWRTRPEATWQKMTASLVATKPAERLVVYPDTGAPRVRVDDLSVVAAGEQLGKASAAEEAAPEEPRKPSDRLGVIVAIRDSFGGGATGTGFYENQTWRLAIWKHQLARWTHHPLFGLGFGTPTAFLWHGIFYDGRLGTPGDPNDVTAPHNSFVNILFRMGLFAGLALLAIVAIALARIGRRLRAAPPPAERAVLVGLTALFAFAVAVASFNVALEGPYLSMFFWTILTLLLVAPRVAEAAGRREE